MNRKQLTCELSPHRRSLEAWKLTRHTVRAAVVTAFLLVASPLVAAQELGVWDPPFSLGFQVVHMAHLPTGKILMWGERERDPYYGSGSPVPRIYDPVTGTLTAIRPPANLFCSGHAGLPDGRILIMGGSRPYGRSVSIFDPFAETWSRAADTNFARFYATLTTLPDGRVIAVLGSSGGGGRATIPEVYDPLLDSWTTLPGADKDLSNYPRNFVGPDGRLISAGKQLIPSILDINTQTWTDLEVTKVRGGPAVMYEPGKVLKSGADGTQGGFRAVVANFNDPQPSFRAVARMAFARAKHNMTLLPDGTVLTTGGRDAQKIPVYAAELWDPTSETYATLASMRVARLYHSAAILLPDGRVLSAGGEPDEKTAEIFSPPYLFKGPRPSITSAPGVAEYGGLFDVQTPDAASVNKVSLIRLGAVTHSFDQNQRFMWLDFTAGTDGITIQAPANANLAPPGFYMLFLISDEGVPSVASYIRMGSP